jgi:hypothetical protein
MILSDEQRAKLFVRFKNHLRGDVDELSALFQNEGDLSLEDFNLWLGKLIQVIIELDEIQQEVTDIFLKPKQS